MIIPECNAEDSDRIYALMRQVQKGTYSSMTLRIYLGRAKGERPALFPVKYVPEAIKIAGNRWGVTYDSYTDRFHVWGGGQPKKQYIPSYTGEVLDGWQEAADDIVRKMPNVVVKWGTFLRYFYPAARKAGYARLPVQLVVDCILQKRIVTAVLVEEDHVNIFGGRAEGAWEKKRKDKRRDGWERMK